MSAWARLAQWIGSAAATPAGVAAAAGTIGQDIAAAQTAVKFLADIAAHKATITEGLEAGLALDKALVPVLPLGVSGDIQIAIALAEALVALYSTLPPAWRAIKVTPSKPYRNDGINPETGVPIGV